MKLHLIGAAALSIFTMDHALAGDATKGEREFMKCKACHAVVAENGTEIVKGGRTGPNLYGIIGRAIGGQEGYAYSPSLAALGESGEAWDEVSFVAFTADPTGWLKEQTGEGSARSKMTFRLRSGGEDIAAYLSGL